MTAARAHAPLRAPRRRKPPIVGSRVAGQRFDFESPYYGIYYGATSDLGQLGDAMWYRLREGGRWSRADAWRISLDVCGAKLHMEAVVSDFGDLVVVQQP